MLIINIFSGKEGIIIKKHSFRSFSFQLFVCIFATSFSLLLVGLAILYHFSINATTKINNEMMEKNLTITAENLENVFHECNRTAQVAFSPEDALSNLKKSYGYRSDTYNSIQHALITAAVSNASVAYISLCDVWGNVISSASLPTTNIPYSDMDECLAYLDTLTESYAGYSQTWYFLASNPLQPSKYCIINMRQITPLNSTVDGSLLLISLSENHISAIYDFLGKDSYIMSQFGKIISAADKTRIGTSVDKAVYDAATKTTHNSLIPADNGEYYYAIFLPSIGSYLIVNSTNEALNTANLLTATIAVAILLFGLLFSMLWANHISSSMTKPLTETKACIEQVRNGNLNIRCKIKRQDEIGYLGESFNHMMDNLNDQIRKNNEQQALAKENELRLLHSQINPHLLYNSLDSALYLMTINDTKRSIEILEQLSNFFKLSLQRGNKLVTISSALAHVDSYLKLQNLCRMKNFHLNIKGDESLYQMPIMHMLLQPIVENSVLHGFNDNFTDGEIWISLEKKESDIIICITDNGMGMDEQELLEIRQVFQSPLPRGKSFGLWNISQRMKMYYGTSCSISIDSELGEYTAVSLRIPCRHPERNEGDPYV